MNYYGKDYSKALEAAKEYYKKALEAAKEYDERCELAHNEPDLLTLSRSLLAAQAKIEELEACIAAKEPGLIKTIMK